MSEPITPPETTPVTPPAPAAEPPKPEEKQEEHMIPKSRFDEVNNKAKEAEAKLAAIEAEKAEQEKKKLEEDNKFKELYESEKAEKGKLALEVTKRDLIAQAVESKEFHPTLSKMVVGSTEEELKASLEDAKTYFKEVQEKLKSDITASDDAGGNGGRSPEKKMTPEEETARRLAQKMPKGFKFTA
ncbi:MAG: hypothetical protein AB9866_19085 [Syntrophobacteraceae bacterium]